MKPPRCMSSVMSAISGESAMSFFRAAFGPRCGAAATWRMRDTGQPLCEAHAHETIRNVLDGTSVIGAIAHARWEKPLTYNGVRTRLMLPIQ